MIYSATETEIEARLTVMDAKTKDVVLALMQMQITIELEMLLQPNLSNEGAQYNRGRVAALESMADSFEQSWRSFQKL